MVNIEGPHRELPKDDSVFDPEKHEKTVHTKGPLKGKETWVRKSAVESDKKAAEEANRRNSVAKEPSWFARLFGTKKETGLDVLTEHALIEHLRGFNYNNTMTGHNAVSFAWITGEINGHKVEMDAELRASGAHGKFAYNSNNFYIDDMPISTEDAKLIAKKILPLLAQDWHNQQKAIGLEEGVKKNRMVLEVLGKLPPKKASELEGKNKQKQLGPKKEE